jgi:glutathione S-transferase
MASADDNIFPAVFVASVASERGFSETQIAEALESLKRALAALKERLGDRRMYLAHGFSLADTAHAGNFVRLRQLAEGGEADLVDYPNVIA